MDEKLVPGIIEALLSVPHVQSVSIWSIDYESNRRWILGSGANTEAAKAWMEKHLVALRGGYPVLRMIPNANMHIIKAINGQLGCGPLEGPLDEIAALEAVGIVWDCTVGIPPEAGRLVGAIYVGFSEALSDAQLDALRAPLWSAAQKLVKQ